MNPVPEQAATVRPRWRRRVLLSCGVLCALGLAAAGGAAWDQRVRERPAPVRTGPAAMAPITRTTLTKSITLTGQLTYGTTTPLTSAAAGMVTWLPAAGKTIHRGESVLRVDDQPVVLLYGDLPMFRPLTLNVDGNDVHQFERNLAMLGYRGFTVDHTYSADTVVAVKRWQHDLGRPETGIVDAGQVITAPGALRVAQPLVRIGASATGDVLSYTGVERLVSVPVPVAQAGWVREGAGVTVRLPNGRSLPGRVASPATPAAPASDGDAAQTAPPAGADQAQLTVLISVADQRKLRAAAASGVEVIRVLQERKNVLTVPVAALLALAEGGYGVEVVTAPVTRIVAVKVGMFAGGRVEISGDGLAQGQSVGVPA